MEVICALLGQSVSSQCTFSTLSFYFLAVANISESLAMVEQPDERNLALSITWLKVILKYSYLIIGIHQVTLLENKLGIKEIGMEFRNPSMCILTGKLKDTRTGKHHPNFFPF